MLVILVWLIQQVTGDHWWFDFCNIADGIGINVQTTLQDLILFGIQEPDMVTGMSIDIL